MHRRALAFVVVGFGLAALPHWAEAQSGQQVALKSASPAPNSAGPAPQQVILRFSAELESGLNRIDILGPGGSPIKTDPVRLGPTDKTELSRPITPSLKPGTYTVRWQAVPLKGKRAQGSYPFTVQAQQ